MPVPTGPKYGAVDLGLPLGVMLMAETTMSYRLYESPNDAGEEAATC